MIKFPKTMPYVSANLQRRYIAGRKSVTEILVLDKVGKQTTQSNPGGRFGLYFWNGREWELEAVYDSGVAARNAATHVRRRQQAVGL
jgi:hypothetical protein